MNNKSSVVVHPTMLLFALLFNLGSWADEKPPIDVKTVRIVITHTLPEIPPETRPFEIQNPNQGPNWTAQSEDTFPVAHWGVIMADVPHQGGQIVLHAADGSLIGSCDVNVIFNSTGFELFGTFDESNSTVDISKWDGKKLKHILGEYKGWEFGFSILGGTKFRTVTHATQGIELNDFAGEWGALGINLGRSHISIYSGGTCVGNGPLDWQSVLKSVP